MENVNFPFRIEISESKVFILRPTHIHKHTLTHNFRKFSHLRSVAPWLDLVSWNAAQPEIVIEVKIETIAISIKKGLTPEESEGS